ncbi:MAG: hypothetical protein M3Y74_09810 [Chloroflexota bacterium]|jgi:hypothetical protein|nr:hypothetical protein [Chloroflexota bacterium]
MSQINVDPGTPGNNDPNANARGAATNNLTWAIAMVLVIAAIAIAVVFVGHSAHLF